MVRWFVWWCDGHLVATDHRHPPLLGETQAGWERRVAILLQHDLGISQDQIAGWFDADQLPQAPSECWLIRDGKLIVDAEAFQRYETELRKKSMFDLIRPLVADLQVAKELDDSKTVKQLTNRIKEIRDKMGM